MTYIQLERFDEVEHEGITEFVDFIKECVHHIVLNLKSSEFACVIIVTCFRL